VSKPVTHARGIDGKPMCGRGVRVVALFQEIGCKRCRKLVAAQNSAYIEQAKALAAVSDVISAGQVAYRVHGSRTRIEHNEAVDFALMAARDEFRRASMLGASRFHEVYLWRQS
jgi:hypothetical protein